MQMTIYNSAKGRLETIRTVINAKNTTRFDDSTNLDSMYSITDYKGGLLIKQGVYDYPVWIYDVSRADIGHDSRKAQELLDERAMY